MSGDRPADRDGQSGMFPGECVECGVELDSFEEAVIYDFELHCRDCGEPRIKISNIPKSTGRKTYVKIETIFSDSEDGVCRVCSEPVQGRFKKYCSGYCKSIAENIYKFFDWSFISSRVKRRDDRTCQRCGRPLEDLGEDEFLEVDHIVPVSEGGHPFDSTNLQTLCTSCHNEKGLSKVDYREKEDVRVSTEEFEQTVLPGRYGDE